MELRELRLELIKLTYTHGRDAPEAVKRAEELEKYVLETGRTLTLKKGEVSKK